MDPDEAEGSYYARREQYEREMSQLARNRDAAAAHFDMAERYEALAVVFGVMSSPRPQGT